MVCLGSYAIGERYRFVLCAMFRGLRVSRVLLLNIVLCLTIAAPNLTCNKLGGGGSTQCPSGYVILLQLIIWYLYQIQPALLRGYLDTHSQIIYLKGRKIPHFVCTVRRGFYIKNTKRLHALHANEMIYLLLVFLPVIFKHEMGGKYKYVLMCALRESIWWNQAVLPSNFVSYTVVWCNK